MYATQLTQKNLGKLNHTATKNILPSIVVRKGIAQLADYCALVTMPIASNQTHLYSGPAGKTPSKLPLQQLVTMCLFVFIRNSQASIAESRPRSQTSKLRELGRRVGHFIFNWDESGSERRRRSMACSPPSYCSAGSTFETTASNLLVLIPEFEYKTGMDSSDVLTCVASIKHVR